MITFLRQFKRYLIAGLLSLGALQLHVAVAYAGGAEQLVAADQRLAVSNAEDLALLNNKQWVIASSMRWGKAEQGALYAIKQATGAIVRLYPNDANRVSTIAGCNAPVSPEAFAPHGVALQTLSSGREMLFVVNHGQRESIEVFEVIAGDTPALEWQGCILSPPGAMGNAVAVTSDYRVYLSAMVMTQDKSQPASNWMGKVFEWAVDSGWQVVPDSDVYAPNGLLVANDGKEIYVNSWAAGEVIKLTRSEQGLPLRETLKLDFLPDNLRWGQPQHGSQSREIVAAGLRSSVADVVRCTMASGTCDKTVATGIASIDADTMAVRCLKNIDLHMGTVALPVADSLWVGPVRGDSIWVLADRERQWDQCF